MLLLVLALTLAAALVALGAWAIIRWEARTPDAAGSEGQAWFADRSASSLPTT